MAQTITGEKQSEEDRRQQKALKSSGSMPEHIAIIMDGNGRWAESQGKMRASGHKEGVVSVRDITEACAQMGLGYLTLYTFSTENWNRPSWEVNALMELLIRTVRKERSTLIENDVILNTIGDLSELPESCRTELRETKKETAHNTGLTLTLALSYSGRWDLVEAVKKIAMRVQQGEVHPEEIDQSLMSSFLTTKDLPDPDLVIRTGGEKRLSNFLLWEGAYSELYFTDDFWPTFRREKLYNAIEDFQSRERRFGRVPSS